MAFYDGKNGLRVRSQKMADAKKMQDLVNQVRTAVQDPSTPIESVRDIRKIARDELSRRRQNNQVSGMDLADVEKLEKLLADRKATLGGGEKKGPKAA